MEYILHLSKDKKFSKLLSGKEPLQNRTNNNLFVYLCASIMGQQLSVKVADVIYKRFLALFHDAEPTPQQVLATGSPLLRNIGLSNAKVSYVKNVAAFAVDQGMDFAKLSKMDNEEVITYLTQIKGVGRWTVEMLLMFALGREDVFAIDDLGVQNAMIRLYKLDRTDRKVFRERMLKISAKWSPYRTYACRHLWGWKDNEPAKQVAVAGATVKKTKPTQKSAKGKGIKPRPVRTK